MSNGAAASVYRSGTQSTSRTFDGTADANALTSLDANGFTVGTSSSANTIGTTYYYVARNQVAGVFKIGSYTGNTTDNRNITGLGFQPVLAMIHNPTAAYWLNLHSHSIEDGVDSTSFLVAGSLNPNRIQTLLNDGFQIGTDGDVNTNGVTYDYFAWAPYTGLANGVQHGITASGSASSVTIITLTAFSATAGQDRVLPVGLAFGQGASTGVSVTFNGHALSLVSGTTATSGNANVQSWSLSDPNAVSADIVASWSGNHDVVIGATEFANVNQATPISTGIIATGSSTAPSVTVASATGFTEVNNDTSTTDAQATVNRFDNDGFTLKWTTTDAVATECCI